MRDRAANQRPDAGVGIAVVRPTLLHQSEVLLGEVTKIESSRLSYL
jgi:hypothetical protein